jgi:cell division septation protein DedD
MTPPQAPQEQPDVIQPEAPVVQAVASKPVPQAPTRFDTPVEPAKYVAITDTVRRAAKEVRKADGRSSSVVQLGAYSSADRVNVAWANLTKRYPALASYTPMRARFSGAKGTFWRLSIKGFDSQQEAAVRCEQLRSRGGNCFVRRVAGDAPVQFASR